MKSVIFWALLAGFFNGLLLRLRDIIIEQEQIRDR